MENIKKINYGISAVVIVLGIVAVSMVTIKSPSTTVSSVQKGSDVVQFVVADYNGWAIKCFQNDSSRNSFSDCFGEKSISDQMGDDLTLHLKLIDRAGSMIPRLKVIAPFGIFLPAGLSLTLPAQEEFTVPVQFCEGDGCYINLDLADDVVHALSNSDALRVSYLKSSRETVELDIGLEGFTDALTHLKQQEEQ